MTASAESIASSSSSAAQAYVASGQSSGPSSSTLENLISSAPAATRQLRTRAAELLGATFSSSSDSGTSITSPHDQERLEALRLQRARVLSNLGPNRKLESELGIENDKLKQVDLGTATKSTHHAPTQRESMSTAFLVSYFVAGGAAGATSRTVVSPLERLKIIMQVQPHESSPGSAKGKGAYSGVWSGLVKMWREEGFAGFMRGNGINCLRIAPYSAVQFTTYETAKSWLRDAEGELDVVRRLTAGALAGIASVVSTYPLDLVRSRISIASASMYSEAKSAAAEKQSPEALRRQIAEAQKRIPGIWEMTLKVYREEGGIRGLYRGCVPTSVGVAPYVALNFFFYEVARKRITPPDGGDPSALAKLACGALAGSISQTLTYPLDVLRRRMQVAGMKDSRLGYHDKNAIDAIRNIIRADGFVGLYRGLLPNLLKVAPSIGTSFLTYEAVRAAIEEHFD